jgi:hypothetical protein
VFTEYLKRSRVNSTFEADHPIPGINQLLLHLTNMYALISNLFKSGTEDVAPNGYWPSKNCRCSILQ